MADPPGNLPSRTADRRLDAATRERLLLVLQEELQRARDEALARGVPPETLAAQFEERIARLRAQINDSRTHGEPNQTLGD